MPQTLRAIAGNAANRSARPPWALLIAVAIVGSCLYGASLALVLPAWSFVTGATWLAVSAGLAWCVFIPCLACATRLPLATCLYASLVAMAGGEVVLCSGAVVNGILALRGLAAHAMGINFTIVGISNVAMLALLAAQLRLHGVAFARTIALWMFILNGTGALFFAAFFPILHR